MRERHRVFHCCNDTERYGDIHCSEHTLKTARSGPSSLQSSYWQRVRFHGTALYEISVPFSTPAGPEVPKPAVHSSGAAAARVKHCKCSHCGHSTRLHTFAHHTRCVNSAASVSVHWRSSR